MDSKENKSKEFTLQSLPGEIYVEYVIVHAFHSIRL